MAESEGLTVSPTEEHEADEPVEPAATEGATPEEEPQGPVTYRMRRAPRYRAFGLTGLVIGVILGAVLAISFPASGDYSAQTILGYFVAIFALLGALLGSGAAVLLDRRKG